MKKILYIGIPASVMCIIFLFLQSCSSQNKSLPYNSTIPYYDVTISENNIREVQVEAILPLVKDTIRMSQIGDSPLKDGYAGFVHDLNATDTKGNSVRLALVGNGIWSVKAPVPSTIVIKYKVNIKHDNVNWTVSSAFARAYSVDGVLFFVGRTVFIAPAGADTSKIKVHYNLPKGWDIATPYAELRNDPNTFQARNLTDLLQNGNLIGKIVQQEINVGELHIIIAGSPSMQQGVEIFQKALTKIINSYQSEMGGAPEGKLVIMGSVSSLEHGRRNI